MGKSEKKNRHKREKKSKHKQGEFDSRKSKKRSRSNSFSSISSSSSAPAVELRTISLDLKGAVAELRSLLAAHPPLAGELIGIMEAIDDGECIVVDGIEDGNVRIPLSNFLRKIGLEKRDSGDGSLGFALRSGSSSSLAAISNFLGVFPAVRGLEVTQNNVQGGTPDALVSAGPTGSISVAVPAEEPQPRVARGPAMPTAADLAVIERAKAAAAAVAAAEARGDGVQLGPVLPGPGARVADTSVVEAQAKRKRREERRRWREARRLAGGGDGEEESDEADEDTSSGEEGKRGAGGRAGGGREEWMTVPPKNRAVVDAMMPENRSFSASGVRTNVDQSLWTETPAEREAKRAARAERVRLGLPPLDDPAGEHGGEGGRAEAPQDPAAAAAEARLIEQLRLARGTKSMVEKHLEAQEAKRKEAALRKGPQQPNAGPKGWDRDRDLVARPQMNPRDAQALIAKSFELNSRFSAPTIQRCFM